MTRLTPYPLKGGLDLFKLFEVCNFKAISELSGYCRNRLKQFVTSLERFVLLIPEITFRSLKFATSK